MNINPLCFSPYVASPLAARVPNPFIFMPKEIGKKRMDLSLTRFEPTTFQSQNKCTTNSYL